jgi:glycosyltransferase involved in cell wall biosynthesis
VRVLYVTTSYPTAGDPTGEFVREHALAASEHVDVTVLHLAREARFGLERVTGEPIPTFRSGFPRRPAAAGLFAAAATAWPRLPAHDLVHAHFFLAGAAAAVLDRRPLVLTEHWSVFLPEDPLTLTPSLRAASRLAFRRAAAVLPVSEALERGILAHAPRTRTTVVRNAIDTSLFHPGVDYDPGLLVSVGMFYEAKGHDRLLAALADVVAVRPDVRLELVGDGELRPALERQAAGLPVTFRGVVPKTEVAQILRRAHLFALPSRFETSGVGAIEALATGVPVVGTRVGAIPELLDADNGVLTDADDLAAAIVEGLDRTFDRAAIAASAREHYGRATIGRQLADVYRKAAT